MLKQNQTKWKSPKLLVTAASLIACAAGIAVWTSDSGRVASRQQNEDAARSPKSQRTATPRGESVTAWSAPAMQAVAENTNTVPIAPSHADHHDHATHDQGNASTSAVEVKNRRGTFDANSFAQLGDLKAGESISIPLFDHKVVKGRVNLVQPDQDNWIRVGGEITDSGGGSFMLATNGKQVSAKILLNGRETAYEVFNATDGVAMMEEKPLDNVICTPIPAAEETAAAPAAGGDAQAAPPILDSLPNATAVVYLDFDGESVTDPLWNNGITIDAQAPSFNESAITDIWNRVKEDFSPFNISITTDLSRYNNAPVGRRMRCIITPTNTAAPGAGGVAYVNSFSGAGNWASSTIPCWVFNGGISSAAEAITHEIGHTLGLSHDGRTSPQEGYYAGHGSGAVGWAPIMGVGYYKSLTQWSKGEYLNANNMEDDVAIITNSANGFGFINDPAGGTTATAAALSISSGNVNQAGVISSATDADVYSLSVQAGTIAINANPATVAPNADLLLELLDSSGAVIASANPDLAIHASLSGSVAAGTYFVRVRGTGRGSVSGDGYSNYGSIGAYQLTGTVPNGSSVPAPVITSAGTASGTVGQAFSYQITATNSPTSYSATGLPAGLTVNASSGLISGIPSVAGTTNATVSATNGSGTGSATLAVSVAATPPTGNEFANSAAIAINDGVASTYPSTIQVSGVSGAVTGVTVSLKGLRHTYPDDIDMMLVGPGGQRVMLMSDHGGSFPISNVNLTFSSAGASALPDSRNIVSGTYRPGDAGWFDNFPAPAPSGSRGTSLAVYNNVNPNGQWRLFIVDDAGMDTGSLANGWSLKFTTSAAIASNNRVLKNTGEGGATLWKLDRRGRETGFGSTFGPFPGWQPAGLTGNSLVWIDAAGNEQDLPLTAQD